MASPRSIEQSESRLEDFDLHYEKINEMYKISNSVTMATNQSFYSNRTESEVHGTNAELILRELFVPIQEDSNVQCETTISPRHWSIKDIRSKPMSRRSTSDFYSGKKRLLHGSYQQRSSLQGAIMRSSISSNSFMTPEESSIQKRRPAIVFSSQLSYSDETHGTMV